MSIRPFLAALALSCTSAASAQSMSTETSSSLEIVRIQASDPAVRQQLGLLTGHFRYDAGTGIAEIETDTFVRSRLAALGLTWQTDPQATAAYRAFVAAGFDGLRSIPGFACYRTVEETLETIDTLVAEYPQLASFVDIGDSWRRTQDPDEGYPLRVLRLTGNAEGRVKPIMFAMSSVHAREYTPAETMTRFAEQLLSGYGVDAEATWLLDQHEFHLLLQANPDGRKRAEQDVLWRKNENTVDAPCSPPITGSRHPGIDLNRNFPWGWLPAGGMNPLCAQTYSGPSAGSEPETQSVTSYLTTIFPDRRPGDPGDTSIPADEATQGMFLDMHSYTGLVLWPWGGPGVTGNDAAYRSFGRRLAWFNDYVPQQSVALYPTAGTTIDFAYGELGVPSFTYEMGTAFFQDCPTFENTIAPDNLASLRYAARTLHAPYILPAGPDAYEAAVDHPVVVQGEPVRITATVDDSRYQPGPGSAPAVHDIAGANVFVNHLPWQNGAIALPMTATDGAFDSATEQVELLLDTRHLPAGRHLLFVQGHDDAGEHGPPTAVFIDVETNTDWIFIDGFETR